MGYLMITNEIDRGWEELEGGEYAYIDQIPYDGPTSWVLDIQDSIAEALDGMAIIDYNSLCFYLEKEEIITQSFNDLMLMYNDNWNKS